MGPSILILDVRDFYCCKLETLLAASTQAGVGEDSETVLWHRISSPTIHIRAIVSLGGQLVVVGEREIHAYSPLTHSWVHVWDTPYLYLIHTVASVPNGSVTLGNSNRVIKGRGEEDLHL